MRESGRLENWKGAVVGGEMIPHQAPKWMGDNYARPLAMAETAHFSWIGPYSPASEKSSDAAFLARCAALVRRMGYEFRLTDLRHTDKVRRGAPVAFTLKGVNQGVAPFYYPWEARMALLTKTGRVAALSAPLASFDVRQWLPGPFTATGAARFPAVTPGVYDLALAIIDPWTKKPGLTFANRLKRSENGWNILSHVMVV